MDKQQLRLTNASLIVVTFFMTSCYLMYNVNPPLLKKLHEVADTSAHKIAARETRLQDSSSEDYEYPGRNRILAIRYVVPPIISPFVQESPFVTEKDQKNIATESQIPDFMKLIEGKQPDTLNYHNGSILLRFFNDILKSKLEIRFSRNEFPLPIGPRVFRIKIRTQCDEKHINAEQVRIKIASFNSLLSSGRDEFTNLSPNIIKTNLNKTYMTEKDDTNVTGTISTLEAIHDVLVADDVETDFPRREPVSRVSFNQEELSDENIMIASSDLGIHPKYVKEMEINKNYVETAKKTTEFVENFTKTTENQYKTYLINTEGTVEIPVFTATEIKEEKAAGEGLMYTLEYAKDFLNTTLQKSPSNSFTQDTTSITRYKTLSDSLKMRSDDDDNFMHNDNSNKDKLNAKDEELKTVKNNSFCTKHTNGESLTDAQSFTELQNPMLTPEDLISKIERKI